MHIRVKICGLTNSDDALAAVDAGADYLGFIFYAKSPRYVTPEVVGKIVSEVRSGPKSPLCVGVFVNEPVERVRAIMAAVGLDIAQFHGDEGPDALAGLPGPAYKAVRPKSRAEALESAARYAPLAGEAGPQLLIDTYTPDAYGGTGQRTDWAIAAALTSNYRRVMLAGGLTPDNVAEAVVAVWPWGVDVSSGVEATPGRKDHEATRRFVASAKAACCLCLGEMSPWPDSD